MDAPTRADYVRYYSTLFDRFDQAQRRPATAAGPLPLPSAC